MKADASIEPTPAEPAALLILMAYDGRGDGKDDRRLPQRRRSGAAQGVRTLRRTVPRHGSSDDDECRDRRQQVQGGE